MTIAAIKPRDHCPHITILGKNKGKTCNKIAFYDGHCINHTHKKPARTPCTHIISRGKNKGKKCGISTSYTGFCAVHSGDIDKESSSSIKNPSPKQCHYKVKDFKKYNTLSPTIKSKDKGKEKDYTQSELYLITKDKQEKIKFISDESDSETKEENESNHSIIKEVIVSIRCSGHTEDGKRCKKRGKIEGLYYCSMHPHTKSSGIPRCVGSVTNYIPQIVGYNSLSTKKTHLSKYECKNNGKYKNDKGDHVCYYHKK